MISTSKIWKELTSISSNLNNFHSLEVVDRVSETQLHVGENSNWIIWRLKGYRTVNHLCTVHALCCTLCRMGKQGSTEWFVYKKRGGCNYIRHLLNTVDKSASALRVIMWLNDVTSNSAQFELTGLPPLLRGLFFGGSFAVGRGLSASLGGRAWSWYVLSPIWLCCCLGLGACSLQSGRYVNLR